jgi:hypothetical protein
MNLKEVYRWATMVHDAPIITLIGLRSRIAGSKLKGVVLTPFSRSASYKSAVEPRLRGRPWKDFYYQVTYESLLHATTQWQAARVVTTHLAGAGERGHADMQGCQCEAVVHLVRGANQVALKSFCFQGCCCGAIPRKNLNGLDVRIAQFVQNHDELISKRTAIMDRAGDVVSISWPINSR